MKRTAVMLSLLLAGVAGAADYATATKHDELRAPTREASPRKVQWAPTGNFSALHARAVFEEESGEPARPYAGERAEVAAGSRIFLSRDSFEGSLTDAPSLHRWAYAHGNPLRFTDPDGRCAFGPEAVGCGEVLSAWVRENLGQQVEYDSRWPRAAVQPQGKESGSQAYPNKVRSGLASAAADQARARAARKEVVVLGEGRSGPSVPSIAPLLTSYTGSGMGAGMSVAEVRHRNTRGAGYVEGGLSTYSGWYEQYTAERARLDQVHTQGTALVAGAALLAVQPELAPLLMDTAGLSMGGAALVSSGVSVTTNASLEYGLTGEVTLEGTAMSVAGEAWTLRGVATEMKAAQAGEVLQADALAAKQIAGDSAVTGGSSDYVTLYHGTSSNRAAKIVGSPYYEAAGFKAGADDAVFFAEDYATAEAFALESGAKYGRGQQLPGSFTVIELQVPRELAGQAGLLDRYLIGEYRGLPPVQMGATPYERILAGDKLPAFNEALLGGQIPFQRLKVR